MEQVPGRDWQAVSADIAAVCGVLNVAHGKLVALTGEAIEADLWKGVGIRSVEHWLTLRSGLAARTARQVVTVARRRAELPATVAALTAGRLSLDQAAAVADLAPAHTDAAAAECAQVMTVTQIRATLSRYAFADPAPAADPTPAGSGDDGGSDGDAATQPDAGTDPEFTDAVRVDRDRAAREADAVAPGRLSMSFDGTRFGLHVDAPADAGALIEKALLEATDALFRAGQPEVTAFDGLVEVANRSLSGIESTGRRDKFRVYLHLDTAGGWLNAGPGLPAVLAAKLSCDTTAAPLWQTEGVPVSVGRSQRIVPKRTRRLIEDRDRTCRFPGCAASRHLEVHHLVHWAAGGHTDTQGLAALCPHHHDAHHRGDFTITGDADRPGGLTFTDPAGHPIRVFHPPTPPTDGQLPAPPAGYQPPAGERIQQKWIHLPPPPTPPPTSAPPTSDPPLTDTPPPAKPPDHIEAA
jgi:hypothetical protein